MKISVIISTHNRSKTLPEMLDSICQQKVDGSFDYEIIIVDNNSTDQTKEVIESFINKNSIIRYVFEPKQGLSNARNAGISHATGEIFAFTDDDVIVGSDWVQNIVSFSKECDFDGVGGKVLPVYPAHTPQWVKKYRDILVGPFLCHDYGDVIKLYDSTMNPFVGANMIIKQRVYKEIGGFNPELGAGKGTMGEDTEYFFKMQELGKKIFYNPNILINHPVEEYRMNLKYVANWYKGYGRYLVVKNRVKEEPSVYYFGAPRYLYRDFLSMLLTFPLAMFEKDGFIRRWRNLFILIGEIQGYRKRSRSV